MGRSDIADNTPDSVELEKVITIFEGGPLEATIAGRVWKFHQPTPVEFAKIKLRGTVLYQGTLAEPELFPPNDPKYNREGGADHHLQICVVAKLNLSLIHISEPTRPY